MNPAPSPAVIDGAAELLTDRVRPIIVDYAETGGGVCGFSALAPSSTVPDRHWHVTYGPVSGWRCRCPATRTCRHLVACWGLLDGLLDPNDNAPAWRATFGQLGVDR